jgi:hypothetical protein
MRVGLRWESRVIAENLMPAICDKMWSINQWYDHFALVGSFEKSLCAATLKVAAH